MERRNTIKVSFIWMDTIGNKSFGLDVLDAESKVAKMLKKGGEIKLKKVS